MAPFFVVNRSYYVVSPGWNTTCNGWNSRNWSCVSEVTFTFRIFAAGYDSANFSGRDVAPSAVLNTSG